MGRRPSPPDLDRLLARMGACREAMVELRAAAAPRSLQRAAADQMIANIDELAWLLTGRRDVFVLGGHGTGRGR